MDRRRFLKTAAGLFVPAAPAILLPKAYAQQGGMGPGPGTVHSAGGGFTPASLSPVAWYSAATADASVFVDAGSTLATNGQTVQQWNDLSTHGYHLKQATSGNRPTYQTAGFNSLPTVFFASASSKWMATTADTVAMGTGLVGSAFAVGATGTATSVNARLVSYLGNGQTTDTGSTGSAAWIFGSVDGGSGNVVFRSFRGGFLASDSSGASTAGTNMRLGNIFDNTNDTYYFSNVAQAGSASASGLNWTSPGAVLVGSADTGSGASFWDGPISEIVICNTALSGPDRLSLDNYFKAKWGLV